MSLTRRDLLIAGLGLTAAGCTSSIPESPDDSPAASTATDALPASDETTTTTAIPTLVASPAYDGPNPFILGVASGDPDPTSMVLWTRLLSSIVAELPDVDYMVAVDVALDENFTQLVSSVVHEAPKEHGHSVHAVTSDLDPNTWYWYRFRVGEHTSPIGRTRTVPLDDTTPLRLGFSSCQNWESGAYAAHRHLAEADLDLFVWLGDYIYEYGPGNDGVVTSAGNRVHNTPEVDTLDGYRARYALYKSDQHLQAHHGSRPWVVTWDDHEVDNNHAGLSSEDGQDVDVFNQRRMWAHQAWWENMPVRLDPPGDDGRLTIYRSLRWGGLVDLHMLDGRQYRAPQPEDGEPLILPGVGDIGARMLGQTALDPKHSMLGTEQRSWLEAEVAASTAVWNVLGNQVYMHGINAFPGEVPAINTDTWDGYFGERKELLETLAGSSSNLVVLSGDFHASTAADVRADPFDPTTAIVATEFMAPAISSAFPERLRSLAPLVLGINPHVRHFDPDNGYMTCSVTKDEWTTSLHILEDRTNEASPVTVTTSFTVIAGTAGIASVS